MYRRDETHRHALEQAVVKLYGWFGEEKFLVKDLLDEQISELVILLGVESEYPDALRSGVGRWLSDEGGIDFALVPGGSVSVEVLERADGSFPGVYRVVKRDNRPGGFGFDPSLS